MIRFSTADVADFKPQTERGTLICNPPYGERLLDMSECEKIYRAMGKVFERRHGWSYSIISPTRSSRPPSAGKPINAGSFITA